MRKAGLFLRTILFYLGYGSALFVCACLCLLIGPFLPLHRRFYLFTLWNAFALWWLKVCCGISLEISGEHKLPPGPFVIISNHQSAWETIHFYRYFRPVSAILKKELLNIPFFGWAIRLLQPVAIDRSKRISASRMVLSKGTETLNKGISVLIFPEGTRTNPGEMKRFSSGATTLAIESKYPVLPLAHDAGKCWPARKFLKYPGKIRLIIGEPIPSEGRETKEMTAEVEAWIRAALAEDSPKKS